MEFDYLISYSKTCEYYYILISTFGLPCDLENFPLSFAVQPNIVLNLLIVRSQIVSTISH